MTSRGLPTPHPDELDPLSPALLEEPSAYYQSLLAHAPVYRMGGARAVLVASWQRVAEALERPDDFSANLTGLLVRGAAGGLELLDLAGMGVVSDSIANADEPDHAVHRRIVQRGFGAEAVERLEPELRRFARERLAPFLAAGGGDFMSGVAEALPTFATALVVGLPASDLPQLQRWGMTGGDMLAATLDGARMGVLVRQTAEMSRYLEARLAEGVARIQREAPAQPTLIERLAMALARGEIPQRHALGILVVLLGAGVESTASLLGSAVRMLAHHVTLQPRLRTKPELLERFIEEVVRLESPFRFHYRVVTRPCELGGVKLQPGDRLLLLWAAANRDPEVFERPGELDLERRHLRRHLGFGRGAHFCVGAPLARMEARIVLEELLASGRELRLDAVHPPRHVPSFFVRRLATLSLRLEGGPA